MDSHLRKLTLKHHEIEILLRTFLEEFGIQPAEIVIFVMETHVIGWTQRPFGVFTVYPDGFIAPQYIPKEEKQ